MEVMGMEDLLSCPASTAQAIRKPPSHTSSMSLTRLGYSGCYEAFLETRRLAEAMGWCQLDLPAGVVRLNRLHLVKMWI